MNGRTATFETDCQDAVNGLRAAFVRLYDSVDADPHSPQDVARRFGLNKTLTWNVSRLLQAPDGMAAVGHVPGRAAIEKMLKATERNGASKVIVEGVRAATHAFERVIEVHLGDRSTLDMVLDGLGDAESDGLERSRKLAFRGNSGLYGVQARAKLVSSFLGPNRDDPDMLDMAMVSGYAGFRRLRGSARWPLFKLRAWATGDLGLTHEGWEPIDPQSNGAAGLALMRRFSEGPLPDLDLATTANGTDIMLQPGPIGNPGAFDCYRGDFMRGAASRYRSDEDATGDVGASITTPVECLVVDLIVHEDLNFALTPEVLVYGRLFEQGESPGTEDRHLLLPIRPRVSQLPGSPPALATPLVPRYTEMAQSVYDRLGWEPARMRGVRLQLAYPPYGTTLLLRVDLPSR